MTSRNVSAFDAPVGTVFLVSCVAEKRSFASEAKDLYTSAWFRKARDYVERHRIPWFILSAEYGLVAPTQIIAPYDRTLNKMSIGLRRDWASRVATQLFERAPDVRRVIFVAGARYREFLLEHLYRRGIEVSVPMEGLRIGEQLGWLGRN